MSLFNRPSVAGAVLQTVLLHYDSKKKYFNTATYTCYLGKGKPSQSLNTEIENCWLKLWLPLILRRLICLTADTKELLSHSAFSKTFWGWRQVRLVLI